MNDVDKPADQPVMDNSVRSRPARPGRLRAASQRIDQLESEVADDDADSATISMAVASMDGHVSDLEADVRGLQDLGGAASTVDELTSRIEDIEAEVDGFGAPVGFGSRIDDLQSRVDCLNRALNDVESSWTRTSFFCLGC